MYNYYRIVSVDRISISSDISSDDAEIRVRKVGEAVVNTISSVASVLEYPKSRFFRLFFFCQFCFFFFFNIRSFILIFRHN